MVPRPILLISTLYNRFIMHMSKYGLYILFNHPGYAAKCTY